MTALKPQPYDFSWMQNGAHLKTPDHQDLLQLSSYEYSSSHQNSAALLMIHGFSTSPAVFRHFYPHLKYYQYVYTPLLKGHGTNLTQFSQVSRTEWLQQIEHCLQKLCQTYDHVDVLGLSLGGLIACYLANHFPLRHLYLLAPALQLVKPCSTLLTIAKIANYFKFESVPNFGGRIHQSQECELAYRQLPLPTVIEILSLIHEYRHQAWSTPTSLFLGKYDTIVNSNAVSKMLENLPNLKLYVLEHTGHVLPIDADYPQIISTIAMVNRQKQHPLQDKVNSTPVNLKQSHSQS